MTIESTLERIASALEKATIPATKPATKPAAAEVAAPEPQQAATMEPDHEVTVPEPSNADDDRVALNKIITKLIQTEKGKVQARAVLLTFHGAEAIRELNESEYSQVTAKMAAVYLSLDS